MIRWLIALPLHLLMIVVGAAMCLPYILVFVIIGYTDPIGYVAVPLSILMLGILPLTWGLIMLLSYRYPHS